MKSVGYRIAALVLLGVLVHSGLASGQSASTLLRCLTPDAAFAPAAPAGERALSPVAIYACGTYADTTFLPPWYDDIMDTAVGLSVPGFYRDNSLGKYRMKPGAFGRNSTRCFTFSYPGADDTPGVQHFEIWFWEVMPKADTIANINFADFDNDGPNGIPANTPRFLRLTLGEYALSYW
ncbi:MAG: hypothetical protein ACM3YF_02235 [Candidatus Zixiibacteriota bacterium]